MRSILPPILVLILIIVAIVIGLLAPVVSLIDGWWRLVGLGPILGGAALTWRSSALFEALRTNIHTFRDPDVLVVDGPFAWSRNPMYLGFATLLAGVAIAVGSLSAWIAPVAFVTAAGRWYIPYEEARMVAHFGDDYRMYQQHCRRWIGRS
ncbi:methyltransferase family protein [Ilumatobacter coccineus]|uniref:Isoprenylcysteine carboxylmethyltransferase family protein n=1 Tax=Ilumatobacter coccineus (strain NBRC 103263 / KCTC 29153 / YM16-304) TaxID=1313172 RepID=A0A6C7E544_ILUCY|nr:isoprenylcysteine carboxylmethyltransferase family protein [Ilumatobacter coccineus]BAN01977.1 hypothetical protein YM304_16630 [Ilumatobacter coccineus YM16-304]